MNKLCVSRLKQSSSIIGYLISLENKSSIRCPLSPPTNMYKYNEHPIYVFITNPMRLFHGRYPSFFSSPTRKQTNRQTGAWCAMQLSDEW